MTKTILAIVEFERFPLEVATRAARIAKLYGCDLKLVLSDPTISFLRSSFMISADSKQMADNVQVAQQEEIERLVESVAEYGVNVSTQVIQDRPAVDSIVALALEIEPFVVVMGTTYHSPAERATFTFNDWQLIRKLDRPLWLVKKRDWNEKPVVVAAIDPMHPDDEEDALTQAIVSSASSLAARAGGTLSLLHTYEVLEEVSSWTKFAVKPLKVPVDELQAEMEAEHRRRIDAVAAKHEIDADNIHMLPGRTREILPAFARKQNADLVVMGAVARSGLKRKVIGSTAEHVLDHVPCDVLIERSG
jgi:universal stress protein E